MSNAIYTKKIIAGVDKSMQEHLPEISVKLTARWCEYKNICVCICGSGTEGYSIGEIPIAAFYIRL